MGVLGVLTVQQLDIRSRVNFETGNDDADQEAKTMWIDLAEDMMNMFELDTALVGYTNIMAWVAQKLVEHLFLSNAEDNVRIANNNFKTERLGSYSYTKGPMAASDRSIFETLPDIIKPVFARFIKNRHPIGITTSVFHQRTHLDGDVATTDWLDHEVPWADLSSAEIDKRLVGVN
jgi:hypothetical protein